MKRIHYIMAIAAVLLLGSCNDWLDVNPRAQIRASKLFETEDGFKACLNGVYVAMAQTGLYGNYTTIHAPEVMARHWIVPLEAGNSMNRLANFDYAYSSVESLTNDIWQNYYNAIAQLNDIIENFENSKVKFDPVNAALIEGEARGLRAFLHLDLLRFFGPVPQGADMGAKAIPYVTKMSIDPSKAVSVTYSEVLKGIEKDLNDAEKLLEADPVRFNSNQDLNYSTDSDPISTAGGSVEEFDDWHRFRQGRFNYYACIGTKARFCQWIGRNEDATGHAKRVIEALDDDGTPKFDLTTESAYSGSRANLTMFGEHLFGLHIPGLFGGIENMFNSENTRYTQTQGNMDICYEKGVSVDDIRYKADRYWEEKNYPGSIRVNHFRKYVGSGQIKSNNRMPLLRLAEMYMIVIENLPTDQALPYFRAFRISRAMNMSTETAFESAGQSDKMALVEREYRKEFFGEGQMFFFYKRLGYKSYTWPAAYAIPADAYVMPKPKDQQAFE